MILLPVPGVRTCTSCSHRWFTAVATACTCPACGCDLAAVAAWSHVCPSGHSADRGGDCATCAREVTKAEAVRAEARLS